MSNSPTGFRCPQCGNKTSFDANSAVLYNACIEITPDGWDYSKNAADIELAENATITCRNCGYSHNATAFEAPERFALDGYERYQLTWMIDHGYSLRDLADELLTAFNDAHPRGVAKALMNNDEKRAVLVNTVVDDWARDRGFNGELYASPNEWQDSEESR